MTLNLVHEENYKETMDTVVWPYLNDRKRELYLKIKDREENRLHVCNYHADHAEDVVVISHGFTEVEHKYGELIYYFLQKGYEVYILEHCGHGKSYRLTDIPYLVHVDHYERYIRDLLKVVLLAKKEQPELPLTIFGHSMGGGIACAAAGRRPELFDRVVVSSPMIQPLTGGLSWNAAKILAKLACFARMQGKVVSGSQPYQGLEPYEYSASKNRTRFDYVQDYKFHHPEAQLCAASYGWINAAVKLNKELLTETYKNITMPFLMLQAEEDQSVSIEAQNIFMDLLRDNGNTCAEIVQVSDSKHEIFNSSDEVVEKFCNLIFQL